MRHGWTMFPPLIVVGLTLCGFTRSAHGHEPTDNRLGERTVSIFLLTRSDIQADLKFTRQQVVECDRAALAFQRMASQLRGRKDAAVVAARREIDENLSQWLTAHLSPAQLARFEQIDLQWEGAAAMLSRPVLDESLNLTPAQKKLLGECIARGKRQRTRGAWSYDDHISLTREAIAILTERQRGLWIHLLGPPCQFVIEVKTAPGAPAVGASSKPSTPRR